MLRAFCGLCWVLSSLLFARTFSLPLYSDYFQPNYILACYEFQRYYLTIPGYLLALMPIVVIFWIVAVFLYFHARSSNAWDLAPTLKGRHLFINLCLWLAASSPVLCLAMFWHLNNSKLWSQLKKSHIFYVLHPSSHAGCGLEKSLAESQSNHVAYLM